MKKIVFVVSLLACGSSFAASSAQHGEAYPYYLKALLLESQGNLEGARAEVNRALALAPETAYLHRTAAELSVRLGQMNRAADEIEKAIELDPKDVKALIIAGQIQWALGDPDKAKERLKKALALDPDETEAVISLAGAVAAKDPKEAIKIYSDFLVRHPNDPDILERLAQMYQLTGNTAKSKETWEEVLANSPNSARAHLSLAQIAEINFDTATAISHYEDVLTQDPTNLPLLLRVGELRYRSNDMQKATEAFTKAKSVAPDSPGANFWLALMAENRGDWPEAIRLLNQLPRARQDPGVLLRLSYYYSQARQYKEAVGVLEILSQTDPSNLDFLNYLAVAYEQNKQVAKAEATFKKMIGIDPNDAEAHFHLATLYDRSGRFAKAEPELKKAIDLDPKFHMALNYLGYSYADRNINLDRAEELVNNAISLEPNNPAYLDSMGWVYYRQGKWTKAQDFLLEATKRSCDPLIWEHLGDVYEANKDPYNAAMAWQESLWVDPDSAAAHKKLTAALGKLEKFDKLNLFVHKNLAQFGNLSSVTSIVTIRVCQPKPCFETKAQFRYTKDDGLSIEIPGPLSAPVLAVTKKPTGPAAFGAIHPQFQSAEPFVLRFAERMQALLSGEVFKEANLGQSSQIKDAGGRVSVRSEPVTLTFVDKTGTLASIDFDFDQERDELMVGSAVSKDEFFPSYVEWRDKETRFSIRLEFLKPVIAHKLSGCDSKSAREN